MKSVRRELSCLDLTRGRAGARAPNWSEALDQQASVTRKAMVSGLVCINLWRFLVVNATQISFLDSLREGFDIGLGAQAETGKALANGISNEARRQMTIMTLDHPCAAVTKALR